jgi:molecular chaperone GrpE
MMKQKKATGKEKEQHEEITNTANVAGNQPPTDESPNEATGAEDDVIKAEADLQAKIVELNDKLLRLYSEFDNYRKRTIREKIEMSKTASEEVITDLLPVMDDFERALRSFEATDAVEVLKEGVHLVYVKLRNTLTAKGLQEIKTLGEPFNTDQQEAIAHIPAPSEDLKNKVVDELQKGYLLNDKVIRFAKVVVGS